MLKASRMYENTVRYGMMVHGGRTGAPQSCCRSPSFPLPAALVCLRPARSEARKDSRGGFVSMGTAVDLPFPGFCLPSRAHLGPSAVLAGHFPAVRHCEHGFLDGTRLRRMYMRSLEEVHANVEGASFS